MSLTNRLLFYLLSLLAAVLVGFSLCIYLLVDHYLHVEADERLAAAMNILVGSLDIEPDTVEWEPADRAISLPRGPLGEEISWYITDINGGPIDASQASGGAGLREELAGDQGRDITVDAIDRRGDWHFQSRHIQASQVAGTDLRRERTAEEIEKGEYPSLVIVAGISEAAMRQAGQRLAIALAVVGLALWVLCFATGRMICRRALRPVSRMAETAKAMSSHDLGQRLPAVPAGDELATMNEAFNQLLDRLQVAFEKQQRFASDASHQLRTPLTIIQGQAEVALRRLRSPEEYQGVLSTVQEQVKRLNGLVETLLFLARADSEAGLPALQPVDLRQWLKEFEETWMSAQADAAVRFENSVSGSLIVSGRPEMLSEVARNLLDNAIKYSLAGRPVVVRLIEAKDRAGFQVEDEGPGMSEEELARVFQPFFRTERAQRSGTEGSGLGLSIASRLCAAMNGEILVESQVERGSAFSVWLRRCGDCA